MADIIVDGRTRVAFVPTIADTTLDEVTLAELNAGTLLQDTLVPTGLEGFTNTQAEVDNTSLGSTFDTRLPGRIGFSGTGLMLKKQSGTDTVFTLLSVPDTNGFIVIRDGVIATVAWTADDDIEVYPIRTGTHSIMGRGEANTVLRYRVPTPIQATPNLKSVAVTGS